MSATSMAVLQSAIYARLTADPAVTSRVTGVYDAVPEGTRVPFVALGDYTEIPNKAFARGGHELTVTIHIYDQDGIAFRGVASRGTTRALSILGAVAASLESMPGTAVQGHTVVEVTYEFGQPIVEADDTGGLHRHIVARFRVILEDTQ